ncbi:type II toxin-antitoxin system RelE family toxin [Helicobacter sp. 23-1048]
MEFAYSKKAQKQFDKLDSVIKKRIKKYTDELETLENPRDKGTALVGNLFGLWRYRVGDYRLICHINDNELIILCLEITHRSEAYK